MFEVITKYNKEIFCKCYRVYYKVFGRYNTKRTSLLLIIYFSLATVNLILGIIKPEIFHTIYASIFFYILSFAFLFSLVTMSDKGIERKELHLLYQQYMRQVQAFLQSCAGYKSFL